MIFICFSQYALTCKFCIVDVIIVSRRVFQTTDNSKEKVDKLNMLYCFADAKYPIEYISCGNLVSSDGFLHARRNLDSFVFLIVCEGTLHINQNGKNFDVHENESMLLFPHQTHYGYQASKGRLSYYWVHFYMTDPHYTIYNKQSLLRYNRYLDSELPYPPPYNFR